MPEIDLDHTAAAQAEGATIIDVREPDEYADGHVPGARNIPLGELTERSGELDRSERLHLICASGRRSSDAADQLNAAGFDAVSVQGGTAGWADSGRPLEK